MRIAAGLVVIAACGGTAPPTSDPARTGEPVARSETRGSAGTTEMSQLSWGANVEAVVAEFPQATQNEEGGLWFAGTSENRPAITVFDLDADGLRSIRITFTDTYPSITECLATWTTMRTDFDRRYGASQSDNGAAYWSTGQADVELACNQNDAGAGEMLLVYTRPEPTN